MKKINSGRLRAIGYDARARMLQVLLGDGSTLQYGIYLHDNVVRHEYLLAKEINMT